MQARTVNSASALNHDALIVLPTVLALRRRLLSRFVAVDTRCRCSLCDFLLQRSVLLEGFVKSIAKQLLESQVNIN